MTDIGEEIIEKLENLNVSLEKKESSLKDNSQLDRIEGKLDAVLKNL